jgi:catechol 2,3-dioxygenase-like lactoylglutathione lyase family enzyme
MILDVWHASFTVADMDRSIHFYRDLLGLPLRHEQQQDNEYTRRFVGYPDAHLRVAQFDLPAGSGGRSGHIIELVQYLAPEGEPIHPERYQPGAAHLAFQVEDTWEMYRRLSAEGVRFISEPVDVTAGINKGGATVYLEDPDGCILELVTAPKQAAPA